MGAGIRPAKPQIEPVTCSRAMAVDGSDDGRARGERSWNGDCVPKRVKGRYRHSVNAPVTAQVPCFATMSAADLALRGLLAPTRPCCPARVCACSSDPTWVASLYAYSLHRAVATVNMDAAAVNIMMALVLPSRRPGFGSGHQTQRQRRHATVAKLAVTVPLQNALPRPISPVRTHPPRALPPSQPHRAPPFGAGKR